MNLKKLFAALLVPALSATVFAGIASADYSCDATTGVRTWTFETPTSATDMSKSKNITQWYLYSDTLSTAYSSEADAKAAQTSEDLRITSEVGNQKNVTYIGEGNLTVRYGHKVKTYLIAPFDGTVTVTGTSEGSITIDDVSTTMATVNAGETVVISATKDAKTSISKITFTPSTSTQNFEVNPITIGDTTTDAGVTFTAAGYDAWTCSIWDKISSFKGTVNFDVQMNYVPTNVEVSAQSYTN